MNPRIRRLVGYLVVHFWSFLIFDFLIFFNYSHYKGTELGDRVREEVIY